MRAQGEGGDLGTASLVVTLGQPAGVRRVRPEGP